MNQLASLLKILAFYLPNSMPRYIGVESVNFCHLKCPVCATSQFMKRPKGEMSLELFKKLIDQIDWKVKMINFGYSGEPLLNKNLFSLVRLARSKGINSGFDTNGFFVEDYAEDIIKSEVNYVNISIDGASQANLVKYRVGSDFEKVVRGIRKLTELKKSRNLNRPFIALQFLIMKHNENDLNLIKKLARECSVDALRVKTFNVDVGFWLSDSERMSMLKEFVPLNKEYSRYAVKKSGKFDKNRAFCIYPFTSPIVLWNGDVSLCCLDMNGEYIAGNILNNSLKNIWKNEKYNQLRKKAVFRKLEICKKCSFDFSVNKNTKF